MRKSLPKIQKKYENDLKIYGQSHRGVGWPRKKDAIKRHEVMSKLIKNKRSGNSILDLGCGLSHFYKYLKLKKFKIKYIGVDISSKMIAISKKRYPNNLYYFLDILKDHSKIPKVDYITINGLFTYKGNYSNKLMLKFVKNILKISASKAKIGISFNVFSESADWKDKKLFYLNLKTITDFICKHIGNKFIVNHDYGLYEYTIFIYKTVR
tara:strand:- start:6218 stop:6847 length:630 start_codon:yes stop_codon:yes gene_type:complete